MKHFMIKYRFQSGTEDEWHKEIGRFIAALDSKPGIKGKISYRCMKERDGTGYYHLASVVDETASKALRESEFFAPYTEKTKSVAGGSVEVLPLEVIAETAYRG